MQRMSNKQSLRPLEYNLQNQSNIQKALKKITLNQKITQSLQTGTTKGKRGGMTKQHRHGRSLVTS